MYLTVHGTQKTAKRVLEEALEKINVKYKGNVIFNRLEPSSVNRSLFTLKVADCKKAGARLGFSFKKDGKRRRLSSACWHVHGDFFDAVLEIAPEAIIKSAGKVISKDGGNWQDWNAGSTYNPAYMSELCDC